MGLGGRVEGAKLHWSSFQTSDQIAAHEWAKLISFGPHKLIFLKVDQRNIKFLALKLYNWPEWLSFDATILEKN